MKKRKGRRERGEERGEEAYSHCRNCVEATYVGSSYCCYPDAVSYEMQAHFLIWTLQVHIEVLRKFRHRGTGYTNRAFVDTTLEFIKSARYAYKDA